MTLSTITGRPLLRQELQLVASFTSFADNIHAHSQMCCENEGNKTTLVLPLTCMLHIVSKLVILYLDTLKKTNLYK